jgi:hypothetical protein
LKIKKAQDARCRWCGDSRQTIAHLLLECRKWRRERDTRFQKLKAAKITNSARRDHTDLETLFEEGAITITLRFIETTGVGRKLTEETNECDSWDINRLDRDSEEEMTDVSGR